MSKMLTWIEDKKKDEISKNISTVHTEIFKKGRKKKIKILQQHFWSSVWSASVGRRTEAGLRLSAFSSAYLYWVWLKRALTLCQEEVGTLIQGCSPCMSRSWKEAGGAGWGEGSRLGSWAYLTRSCEHLKVLYCCGRCYLRTSVQRLRKKAKLLENFVVMIKTTKRAQKCYFTFSVEPIRNSL